MDISVVNPKELAVIGAALGAAAHLFYFHHGEHHIRSPFYTFLLLVIYLPSVPIFAFGPDDIKDLHWLIVILATSFLTGVYISLLAYRVLFHPLNKFPGPLSARFSTLWWMGQNLSGKHDSYKQVIKAHEKYGPFVRVGSSDLAILHKDAVTALYGPNSKCIKSSGYDTGHPTPSLQTIRDKRLHGKLRRMWSPAFSDKMLRGYEERILTYRMRLMAQFARAAEEGEKIDIEKWFYLYSFDVMGDLVFADSFHMLEEGKTHWAIDTIHKAMSIQGFNMPIWLFMIIRSIPGVSREWWKLEEYCSELLVKRIKNEPEVPDIMSTLIPPWTKNGEATGYGKALLEGDSKLLVIAGSDTTSVTLTNTIFELLRHPDQLAKLRAELNPFVTSSVVDFPKIQNLPHLNGVINEALRLHPAVPTKMERVTPPEGITIGERFIEGGMTVWASQYALGRSDEFWVDAKSFVPERWYERPEMILERDVYAPFSIGPEGCIGKSLALQNMRNTLSQFVVTFDMEAAPGQDLVAWEGGMQEHFTTSLPPLNLILRKREA